MSKSIASLLTFAVTTSLALANGGEGDKKNPFQGGSNWKPGQGLQLAQGEDYSLNMSGQLQAGFESVSGNDVANSTGFDIPRARLAFTGHAVSKDLTFRLMIDGTDDGSTSLDIDFADENATLTDEPNGPLKDGWAQWAFSKSEGGNLSLRIGQGLSGHGLESTSSETGLFFVERSITSRAFGQDRNRDTGTWIHGSHSENSIRWVVGAQNDDVSSVASTGDGGPNDDNELTYVGSVSFDPMGDMTGGKGNESIMQGDLDGAKDIKGTFGAGVMLGNSKDGADDVESTQFNVNTAWMLGNGLTVQGEYFDREDSLDVPGSTDTNSDGWFVTGTYTLPKSGDSALQWGFGARYSMITSPVDILGTPTDVDLSEMAVVVNAFYHGHAAKTQIEVARQEADTGVADASATIIRVQFQILF